MKNILFVLVVLHGLLFSNLFVAAQKNVEMTEAQIKILETLPADQRESVIAKMRRSEDLKEELGEAFEGVSTFSERLEEKQLTEQELLDYQKKSRKWIYGYEQFRASPTTFTPAANVPVPPSFTLGPGDKLKVEYFGNEEDVQEEFISRSGVYNLPLIGPVILSGLTFSQAQKLIKEKVENKLLGTEVFVSISETRSVTVYVLGEAYMPGAYTVSSLSTITNLLFVSGGVNESGSVRNIQLRRKGQKDIKFDLYNLLLKGDTSSDIRLLDGDVIFIPIIKKTARAEGSFRRPYLFEMDSEDTVRDLIFYSGGFRSETSDNARMELSTINSNLKKREVVTFLSSSEELLNRKLKDGDSLKVFEYSSLESARAEVTGQVKFPGVYTILPGDTLSDLINRAGGLNDIAYSLGSVFTREEIAKLQKDSFIRTADSFEQALADALTGGNISGLSGAALGPISALIHRLRNTRPVGRMIVETDPLVLNKDPAINLLLEDGDKLFVPKRPSYINVVGEVFNPSSHTFISGQEAKVYLSESGGFRDTADKSNIYVILPDGSTSSVKQGLFTKRLLILPGSTIVIPRDPRPFDWLVMGKTVAPILANLATSAAAMNAISSN